MAEEFALCWNNFADNITTGLQSLSRGQFLADVTIAVEGKLLQAHKVVLSICSPHFREIFLTNPCQHPVIILNNMREKLVSNVLEFIYQGSVNVLQTDLQEFMQIAEALKIKGLTNNLKKSMITSEKPAEEKLLASKRVDREESLHQPKLKKNKVETEVTDLTLDDDVDADSQVDNDQFQIIPMPEISIMESRFDSNSKSRDSSDGHHTLPSNLKIAASQSLNFGLFELSNEASNLTADVQHKNPSSNAETPNEVPSAGTSITMLSSTSLLHGNCIFNRNNTVATQAGLKTYWLCKSYRVSMCKARCITHQGKVISATGIHNHQPHMSNKPQEIPPGYTPNVFYEPSSSHVTPQHVQPHSTQHMQLVQQYQNYAPQHYIDQQFGEIHGNMRQEAESSLLSKAKASSDQESQSSGSSQVNFKIEHI